MTTDYNTLDEEDFEEKYKQTVEQWELLRKKEQEEEEQKLQDKFLASLDLKSDEKDPPRRGARDRSRPKKKLKSRIKD